MITYEDIQAIIKNHEKEKITIELKSFRKLFDANSDKANEKRRDLSYEIVAFANRFGGKIILGLNDDGTFDGKMPLTIIPSKNTTIDEVKGIIHQICYDSISPRIDITTQFLECPEGDLLIVYVPKRKNIPIAVTPNKKPEEINSRIYYIRTSHGKRLISDTQLEWLFKHDTDPNYIHKFRIAIELNKQFNVIGEPVPWGNYYISNFIQRLKKEELNDLLSDSGKFGRFWIQILPFLILRSIYDSYKHGWYIGMNEEFDRKSSGTMITPSPIPSVAYQMEAIPIIGENTLESFSWNFKKVLKEQMPDEIHFPFNTEVSIIFEENTSSKIVIKNPDFEFIIILGLLTWGSGLNQKTTNYEVLEARDPDWHNKTMFNFNHIDCAGYFQVNFSFPEEDIDMFNKYYHYANTLKVLIEDNWDYQKLRQKLPSKEILIMDNKLDEILQILKPTS